MVREGGEVLDFWALVHPRAATVAAQVTGVRERLAELSLAEVAGFHQELLRAHRRAFRWELWAAFDLACGGLSDQQFTAARNWLVLQGRPDFDRVIADPDSLADLWPDEPDDLYGAAGLSQVAGTVLTARGAGGLAAELESPELFETPAGTRVTGSLEQLRAHFPRIAKRYEGSAI